MNWRTSFLILNSLSLPLSSSLFLSLPLSLTQFFRPVKMSADVTPPADMSEGVGVGGGLGGGRRNGLRPSACPVITPSLLPETHLKILSRNPMHRNGPKD